MGGKLKDKEKSNGNGEAEEEDLPELASLSNRFSYFENFNEKEETRKKKSRGGDEEGLEVDSARRECKAKSLVNKFKEMETRAANGESEVEDRKRPLKRFTPPRKLGDGSETESGSEYSDDDYSESSYTSSYTGSSSSDSEDEDDELRAFRDAQRAKELRRKFEVWENSQDAKDQLAQMEAYDENGERLETAGILRRKFEALRTREEEASKTPPPVKAQFRPKRFK